MHELFARWAPDYVESKETGAGLAGEKCHPEANPVTVVTGGNPARLQDIANNIRDVTGVTAVTEENQPMPPGAASPSSRRTPPPPFTESTVTAVTPVTDVESQGNFCNRARVPTVTAVTNRAPAGSAAAHAGPIPEINGDEEAEILSWPRDTQRVFEVLLEFFEGNGFSPPEMRSLAYAAVKGFMGRLGGPVTFRETSPDLPPAGVSTPPGPHSTPPPRRSL